MNTLLNNKTSSLNSLFYKNSNNIEKLFNIYTIQNKLNFKIYIQSKFLNLSTLHIDYLNNFIILYFKVRIPIKGLNFYPSIFLNNTFLFKKMFYVPNLNLSKLNTHQTTNMLIVSLEKK